MVDGQSVDVVDARLMRKLAEALRNDTVGRYAAAHKSES
jgi:hypothetical protein